MLILGIESSCDETAAAVIKDGSKILSNIIASQIPVHSKYGGVVPELASRKHVENILPVIRESLDMAKITLKDLDGIAVTKGPGLVGSLLVGISVAKALGYALNIPFVGINHIQGHISSVFLEKDFPDYPFLALVVSGGHTHLYLAERFNKYMLWGQTRDDAAGEAFDKVAKLLSLGYPGGVIIDKLAKEGDFNAIHFPRARMSDNSHDFSFSGLKTAVVNYVKKLSSNEIEKTLPDIVASFQEAVVDVLIERIKEASNSLKINKVVVAGGVAANSRLRERLWELAGEENLSLFIPHPSLCTDNAAMIGVVGDNLMKTEFKKDLKLNALARWEIGEPF
jgi:N6-L-threonylcarbamoyladenine synthase